MKTLLLLLLGSLLHVGTLQAQLHTSYAWQLTDEDDLPSLEIYDLYQDSRGYVWISTNGGLCRYDGQHIKKYTNPNQKAIASSAVKEDRQGKVWYRNFASQLFFIDSSDQVQLFNISDSISINSYFQYFFSDSTIEIISRKRSKYHFSKHTWECQPIVNTSGRKMRGTNTIHEYGPNKLLYVNSSGEIWQEDSTMAMRGVLNIIPYNKQYCRMIYWLPNDSAFLFTANTIYLDALSEIASLKEEAIIFNLPNTLIYQVKKIGAVIWVATNTGLYQLRAEADGNWEIQQHLLPDNKVSCFLQGREGSLWVGTLDAGVFIFPNTAIQCFDNGGDLRKGTSVYSLETFDDEYLYVGISDKVLVLDAQTDRIKQVFELNAGPVWAMEYHKEDQSYIFSTTGLQHVSKDKPNINNMQNLLPTVHHMAVYQSNQLLVSGLPIAQLYSLLDKKSSKLKEVPLRLLRSKMDTQQVQGPKEKVYFSKLFYKRVTSVEVDQLDSTVFWIATKDSLFRYQSLQQQVILSSDGESLAILDMYQQANGDWWFLAVNDGLYCWSDGKIKGHWTTQNGLPSNTSTCLVGKGEWLWIASDEGLIKWHIPSEKAALYNRLDGLSVRDIKALALVGGKIWIATLNGLFNFPTHLPSQNKEPPIILLKSWQINGQSYPLKTGTSLSYEERDVKFEFAALALKSRQQYSYEYRLIGLDSTWSRQAAGVDFVRFQQLNVGNYCLELQACNEDNIKSEHVVRFAFEVRAPYWQQWWFFFLVGMGLLGIIVAIINWWYRLQQQKLATQHLIGQLKNESLQAQMNPHFIFNAMSTIQSFWMHKEQKLALVYHAKFAQLMRLIFEYSKEKTIHIAEELKFLKLYIELETIRFSNQIEVQYDIEEDLLEQDINLAPLLIQPIIENSFKHGLFHKQAAGTLCIKMQQQDQYLHVVVEDDGVGRVVAASYKHLAQQKHSSGSTIITKERLNLFNEQYGANKKQVTYKISDLVHEDGSPAGTRTEVWIPIV